MDQVVPGDVGDDLLDTLVVIHVANRDRRWALAEFVRIETKTKLSGDELENKFENHRMDIVKVQRVDRNWLDPFPGLGRQLRLKLHLLLQDVVMFVKAMDTDLLA